MRREELEGPADRTAGPLDWPASDARSLVLELAGDAPLLELVTIRQLRRKRIIREGTTRVELSLDEVDVVSRSRVIDRFVELEAELVKGAEERLTGLAAVFGADPALAPANGSKLEAAMAAVRAGGRPHPAGDQDDDAEPEIESGGPGDAAADRAAIRAPASSRCVRRAGRDQTGGRVARRRAHEHTEVTPSTSDVISEDVDEAVSRGPAPRRRQDAGRHARTTTSPRPGARSCASTSPGCSRARPGHAPATDPEELHAMRVATRRQRAAWRVFGASFRAGRTKRYRNGLREIASRLGAVRDLDVLLEAADLYRADLPVSEQRALEPLLSDWREHRDDARVLLIRELDSDGYRRWVDDYRDFVRTEGASVVPVAPDPAAPRPRHDRVAHLDRLRAGPRLRAVLRWADVETLHELRIAGKWLRYTLEFVREALGDDAAPLIARVTALQDHLGLMNDANVSASMARTFLVEHAGELSPLEGAAIGRYLVSREREVARLRRTIGAPWRGVSGVTFRRTLGRVVAGL